MWRGRKPGVAPDPTCAGSHLCRVAPATDAIRAASHTLLQNLVPLAVCVPNT